MAEVTVKQLAEDVGAPVERLLKQIQDAGIAAKKESDIVTDTEKQQLLQYLKRSHGEADTEPKKITLKRKTTTTLRASGAAGKAKTVSVEVRKKRTFIKKADVAADQTVALDEPVDEVVDTEVPSQEVAEVVAPAVEIQEANVVETPAVEVAEPSVVVEAAATAIPPVVPQPLPADIEAAEHKKAKKKKHKDHDERDDEGKPKKKSAGHRGPKHRPESIDAVIGELDDDNQETRQLRRKKKSREKTHQFEMPSQRVLREVAIPETITVAELANRMSVKGIEVIKILMGMGVMATINQPIEQETAILVVEEKGHKYKLISENALEESVFESISYEGEETSRAPVVSVMGHVDHGKTSLLDYIRRAKVAAGESGGITQHIGAYHVETDRGMITFLDTPGHAAFTAMRARGAKCTDIVILVVAADDGVMPQTEEAVQHARSAGVPLVVAVNKIDKEAADPDRVKSELAALDVLPEDWGGDVQFINVSAHSGQGIDDLLDAILLQSEMLELKAVPGVAAKGVVVESSLDKGRGAVSTVLVQNGTLKQGDIVIAGRTYGRVRAMLDENGQKITEAGPSIPVEILGLTGTPDAGDDFLVVADEKKAREITELRESKEREQRMQRQQTAKLENIFSTMGQEEVKTLNIVLKTDVRGSLEALLSALADIGNDEVMVRVISSGVGGITETDATLALASNAVLVGFNVRADGSARRIIEKEGLDLRYYSVIYNIIDDVRQALTGMLSPEYREDIVGVADVRDTFRSPKFGQVAGCMVTEGTVYRNKGIRVLRDNIVIFEGELESLRRFKDDVSEVRNGMECGIGVKNYDVKVGDKIEVFDRIKVERKLA
ncbi:MAG: translation initiation factor IF-2 [Hahellaceae bacterium]|nr:translation initiation factor IF-2 [Hahellaceae bacterium]